jgi:outer membrane protein assembly factor BamB
MCGSLFGSDWPQLLGPERNGISAEAVKPWAASGPVLLWKKQIGAGFAAPVVAQGKLLLFHRTGNSETLEALDPTTGKPVWKYEGKTNYRDDFGFDEGPRAAPTVEGGRVFTYGAEGVLTAVDLNTGKKLWSVDVMNRYQVEKGFFGAAGAPLVYDGRVMINAGGKGGAGIVAFDAATGRELWKATNDEASYSSGAMATIGGRALALFFTRNGLTAVDPASGAVVQQVRHRSRSRASVNAATPLADGNEIFVSASYGTGALLLNNGKPVWTNDDSLSNHYSTSVKLDGHLYGFHGRQEEGQALRCVECKTGKVLWSEEGYGAGTLYSAGGQLLILRESGELVLAAASAKGYQPLAKAKILPGTVRTYPALSNGLFFARNTDTLIALRLP